MNFEYKLTGTGWAEATISNSKKEARMTVSYLHDSLGDLTKLLVAFFKKETDEGSVVFMDEPGESEMILKRDTSDRLSIEVRWFRDWASWDMYPKDKFEVIFEDVVEFREVVNVFKMAIEDIYNKYGKKKYKEEWVEHDFPESELLELRKLTNL